MTPLATSYLVPNAAFLITVAVLVVGLTVVPLVQAVARGRWGWALVILLLSPLGGLLWYAVGRRQTALAAG